MEVLNKFRAVDYSDKRLYNNDLLSNVIYKHIWFIENAFTATEKITNELNFSAEKLVAILKDENGKFNIVIQKWFEVLGERGLSRAAEYLSNRLRENDNWDCLSPKFKKQLIDYNKMAIGEKATDIMFSQYTYYPNNKSVEKLSDIKANYYLVIFAASWCPHCREALPIIAKDFKTLQKEGIEIILVSIDDNINDFSNFCGEFPFTSTTDLKKWNGKTVNDYRAWTTPTYYLLNKNLEIVLKPRKLNQLYKWIN
jgi:thiol-disulfide isomerase/thioredoxin